METTHTPQGDGNISPILRYCGLPETTHTPQGDGNPRYMNPCCVFLKQPTPRKGTETHKIPSPGTRDEETTHTPQGDGNPVAIPSL